MEESEMEMEMEEEKMQDAHVLKHNGFNGIPVDENLLETTEATYHHLEDHVEHEHDGNGYNSNPDEENPLETTEVTNHNLEDDGNGYNSNPVEENPLETTEATEHNLEDHVDRENIDLVARFCSPCNKQLDSDWNMQEHIRGKRHIKAMEKLGIFEEIKPPLKTEKNASEKHAKFKPLRRNGKHKPNEPDGVELVDARLGVSVKVWQLGWDPKAQEVRSTDSSVFVFQDRSIEDLSYIKSVIKHLAGDGCLDDVFSNTLGLLKGSNMLKGEVVSKDEPKGEVQEPIVKLEIDDVENSGEDLWQQEEKADWEGSSDGQEESEAYKDKTHSIPKPSEFCNSCGRGFKKRIFFIFHLKKCNPGQIPELDKSNVSKKVQERMEAVLEKNLLSCQFCPRRFTFKKALDKHENLHREDPDSPKLIQKERKPFNPATRAPRGHYQCDKCSTSFKVYSALERHMEAHMLAATAKPEDKKEENKHRPYLNSEIISKAEEDSDLMRCSICDLVYTTRGLYEQHMKKYHDKGLSCEECGKPFTLPKTLKNHKLTYHTIFPKDCEYCGERQSTKKNYQDHMKKAHGQGGGEPQVPCEVCGKLVKSKHILKSHMKLVHEKDSAMFPCDKCGKVLKSKGSLDYHSRTHTGDYKFRCDECGRGYMRYEQVQDCKNTHAGIFRFNCHYCDYKTNKKEGLAKHLTTHSAAKPWLCPICQHTSSTTSNLNGHVKKVHKMTLCQAEVVTNRSRYGREMTDNDLEQNRVLMERAAGALETARNHFGGS